MKSRLSYVDGLRAVAVLAVVLDHAALHSRRLGFFLNHPGIRPTNLQSWLAYALGQGRHGVELFFVLSGFCLAYPTLVKLHRSGNATFDPVDFLAKRIVRIIPPYYAAIALITIGLGLLAHAGYAAPGGTADIGVINTVKEALFLDLGTPRLNGSFWTLAVEFRWYFLFPIFLLVWARSPRVFMLAVAAAIFIEAFTQAASLDLWALPAFLLGIVAADLEIRRDPIRRYAPLLAVVAVVVGVICELGIGSSHLTAVSNILGFRCIAFLVVVAAGTAPLAVRILGNPVLTAIGVASYSIYLVHEPISSFMQRSMEPMVGDGGAYAIGALAGIAGGFVFWRVVEWPFVETALRKILVTWVHARLNIAARACGIPQSFHVRVTAEQQPATASLFRDAAA